MSTAIDYQYLRIWELECRRKSASGLVKADLRPHSSKFSHLLSIALPAGVWIKWEKPGFSLKSAYHGIENARNCTRFGCEKGSKTWFLAASLGLSKVQFT
jgi:hypothetical protein